MIRNRLKQLMLCICMAAVCGCGSSEGTNFTTVLANIGPSQSFESSANSGDPTYVAGDGNYVDANSNGVADVGEYTDADSDGIYDEPYYDYSQVGVKPTDTVSFPISVSANTAVPSNSQAVLVESVTLTYTPVANIVTPVLSIPAYTDGQYTTTIPIPINQIITTAGGGPITFPIVSSLFKSAYMTNFINGEYYSYSVTAVFKLVEVDSGKIEYVSRYINLKLGIYLNN